MQALVEGEIEITLDGPLRMLASQDDHELKLWLRRAFAGDACYRVDKLVRHGGSIVRAVVALKIDHLSAAQRAQLDQTLGDAAPLRDVLTQSFAGPATCRVLGTPRLTTFEA